METISGYFLLFFSAALVFQSLNLSIGSPTEPGPGFLGFFLGLGLFILSGSFTFINWKRKPQKRFFEHKRAWIKPFLGLLFLICFASFMDVLGTIGAMLLFFFLWMRALEKKGWVITALIAGIGTTSFYFLFGEILRISLPKGLF